MRAEQIFPPEKGWQHFHRGAEELGKEVKWHFGLAESHKQSYY